MDDPYALSLRLNTETKWIYSNKPTIRALEIVLDAPQATQVDQRMALNLSMVLDRSGSMSGEKLVYAKKAAEYVLDLLNDGDRISLVAYDDEVTLLSESTAVTAAVRQSIKRRLSELEPGGSTNLSGGWLAGCQQVAQFLEPGNNQVDRVLLLTDGLANHGITSVEELAFHARELVERGVATSTFGVGEGFNEHLLEVMANQGGGNFTYIISPEDIPGVFEREFGEMMAITARDVEINLDTPRGVEATVMGNWRAEKNNLGRTRIHPGSLGSGQKICLYVMLRFEPSFEDHQVTLRVAVRGRSESGDVLESRDELVFTYADLHTVDEAETDHGLLTRFTLAWLSNTANHALKLERQGEGTRAVELLDQAVEQCKGILQPADLEPYRQAVQQMRRGMVESERKQAHYQTYLSSRQKKDAYFESRLSPVDPPALVLLQKLIRDGVVRVQEHELLTQPPPRLPDNGSFDRVEGMLLGLAVGDALGNTTEGKTPVERRAAVGEITGYLPNPKAGGKAVGLPSDDTQLAFWTLEVLLQEGELNPDVLARRFTQERIFGIGGTVKEFIAAHKDQGRGWRFSGRNSAGNGALMRIAPVLLPYLRQPTAGLWADAVIAGMVTHNDYASNAACAAFTGILWQLIGMQSAPPPDWWAEAYYQLAAPLEGNTNYVPRRAGITYRGSVAQFVRNEVEQAIKKGWSVQQAGDTWGSGAYLLETLPTLFHILAVHGHDPEQAILRAVNDTKDNDTIAAMVGAAMGALHGKYALPESWLAGLLGRTNDRNDGHIFRLIDSARARFW